jgi:ABC-type dipeptide/oligopeptide/nickel transport system permease component
MRTFILRRLLNLIPVLLGVALAAFVMMYVLPGDPAAMLAPQHADARTIAAVRAHYRLDAPLHRQFVWFLGRAVRGDFGESIRTRQSVSGMVLRHAWPTAQLAAGSLLFAILLGVTAGVFSAARPRSFIDAGAMLLALAGVSMPVFWLGMMLIISMAGPGMFFAVGYEPLSLRYFGLPCVALGSVTAAMLARLTRSAMLEVLSRDFVRTARAMGVSEWRVLFRHALRNALVPIVTVIGVSLAGLLSGAVLTETVFNIPGLGRMIFDAIASRDYPVVVAGVIWMALAFVTLNLLVDLTYAALDPRIRYE